MGPAKAARAGGPGTAGIDVVARNRCDRNTIENLKSSGAEPFRVSRAFGPASPPAAAYLRRNVNGTRLTHG